MKDTGASLLRVSSFILALGMVFPIAFAFDRYDSQVPEISEPPAASLGRVFDDGELMHDTVLWFYAPKACTSRWHESQQFVAEIGSHRLFAPW